MIFFVKITDYEKALKENKDSLILKVHRSNFSIDGFVEEVNLKGKGGRWEARRRGMMGEWCGSECGSGSRSVMGSGAENIRNRTCPL